MVKVTLFFEVSGDSRFTSFTRHTTYPLLPRKGDYFALLRKQHAIDFEFRFRFERVDKVFFEFDGSLTVACKPLVVLEDEFDHFLECVIKSGWMIGNVQSWE